MGDKTIASFDKREWDYLHREYKHQFGYMPRPENYLCTANDYFVALKKAVKNGVKLETLLKTNPLKIKNQRLIGSLNNNTSGVKEFSDAQAKRINRQDKVATKNIVQIKHGGTSSEKGVQSVVNEIRTVQSNKNLSKTRRAVIVRDNKEHAPRTILAKTANFLSFVAVAIVAVFLGVFVGNMFVAKGTLIDYSNINESDYLPAYATVYNNNVAKQKSQILAANAYVMAEGRLLQMSGLDSGIMIDNYSIVGTGTVRAKVSGIIQNQKVKKTVEKTATTMTINNLSKGIIAVAEKTVQDINGKTISSYVTDSVSDNLDVNYPTKPKNIYDLDSQYDEFRKEYGISPYAFAPYLVSEKTVKQGEYVGTKDIDGEECYEYKITLDNIVSVVNYVQYMMHTSGLKRPPTFYELTITFVVDADFRFKQMDVYEQYQMYYLGLPAECEAQTNFIFSYGE